MQAKRKTVIVGGGFGGLAVAQALRRAPVDITLLDRRNFHLFQPLLYQVATGELSPANIASPLRAILRHQKNCRVLLAEVASFDLQGKQVTMRDGSVEPFDDLIVATGARHSYFGNDSWEPFAPGLKTIEDATEMRKQILRAFEEAEKTESETERRALLTFVIVGAGPTGVELAGALAEIARYTLLHDFRRINSRDARVLLVEAGDRPLSFYPERLTTAALESLKRLGVEPVMGARVTKIDETGVEWICNGQSERIETRTVVWAAGVQASPLGKALADASGAKLDRAGRVIVEPDLTLAGYPHVYVIGDLAHYGYREGKPSPTPLPGLAPVAIQQGQFVAGRIRRLAEGAAVGAEFFNYHDRGSMAVIGRYAAVAQIGKRQWSGLFAWLIWLVIHLITITQFRNRVLVMVQWGWTFFTRDRGARLITHIRDPNPG